MKRTSEISGLPSMVSRTASTWVWYSLRTSTALLSRPSASAVRRKFSFQGNPGRILSTVGAQLAAQNQVRIEGSDGFEIELTRGAHSLYIYQLIFEVSGLAGGVLRTGDADGSHAEAQNLIDFPAVENHDSLWLLLKGSFAA